MNLEMHETPGSAQVHVGAPGDLSGERGIGAAEAEIVHGATNDYQQYLDKRKQELSEGTLPSSRGDRKYEELPKDQNYTQDMVAMANELKDEDTQKQKETAWATDLRPCEHCHEECAENLKPGSALVHVSVAANKIPTVVPFIESLLQPLYNGMAITSQGYSDLILPATPLTNLVPLDGGQIGAPNRTASLMAKIAKVCMNSMSS